MSDAAKIKAIRYQIQLNLEDYVSDRQYESRGRFGEILLMLPSLHSITRQLVELLQLAMSCGAVKVDNLLQEMLLGGTTILLPGTHRRRRRDSTVELRRVGVGGVNRIRQLAHDECRRIRSTVWKLNSLTT